jgi:hypothetical protein
MFTFFGRLIGIALHRRNLLNMDLPSVVWKALVLPLSRAFVFCMSS